MGLSVRSAEVEFGPSQFEFTFDPAPAMEHADNMVIFRTMVRQLCQRKGLHATFMCRPAAAFAAASGWHLHQSLVSTETGENLFMSANETLTPQAAGWISGLLAHAEESCLLTTPTVNGYKRYQPFQLAPDRIQWGRDNRGAMIRALLRPGDEASRVENRVAEPAANPHYFFASQILSGLSGIEQGLQPQPPVETPYQSDAKTIPTNLGDAIAAFEAGTFYRNTLGDEFVTYLSHLKRAEWNRYLATVSEWEDREYSTLF
jgi:glutamine synthetase